MKAWTMTAVVGCWAVAALGMPAVGDDPPPREPAAEATQEPASLPAIDRDFERQKAELERQRLRRLARLAARQDRSEADRTYEALFQDAIAGNLYRDAEPIAEKVLAAGAASPYATFLAAAVNVIAEVDRGAYEDSLASLRRAVVAAKQRHEAGPPGGAPTPAPLPLDTRLSLLEIYFQRLVHEGQFDVARRAFELIRGQAEDPALLGYLDGHLQRLALVGKPAPPIVGTDLDGKPVSLADDRGQVVLVTFWASWCVPSAQEVDDFRQFARSYHDRGFRVLGVNLDTLQDGGRDLATVLPNIKRFLIDHNVTWPNLINGSGERDYARAYGITDLPANVLIGRDGTVVHFDLTPGNIERGVAKALGR